MCNIARLNMVTNGLKRLRDGFGRSRANLTFPLIMALWSYPGLVVRDRIELSDFRMVVERHELACRPTPSRGGRHAGGYRRKPLY